MVRIRILLADDHTLFCNLLRELLEPEYEVVGIVSDGRELLAAAETLRPDVVLADISMPSLNGLDAGRRLKEANPKIKLIFLTMIIMSNLLEKRFMLVPLHSFLRIHNHQVSFKPFAGHCAELPTSHPKFARR